MKPFLTYTLARLGLFVGAYAVVWLIASIWLDFSAITNLWVMLIALVVSAFAAMALLGGLRQQLAQSVQQRAERMTKRIEESRSAEDVD
ncbi:MAG: DUF4229 domain-containing protein [Actinomycetota bacterium]|nr:DUF4229 domain-containing protein [Actinomycetota bacterium]